MSGRSRGGGTGRGRAEGSDLRRHVRSGKPSGKKLLELAPRLAARFHEQGLGVLLGQVRGQQEESGQVNRTVPELVERARKPEREFRHARPLERFVFRVSQAFPAIAVQRATSLFEVELAAKDFDQVLDDVGAGLALREHELGQAREKIRIGQIVN